MSTHNPKVNVPSLFTIEFKSLILLDLYYFKSGEKFWGAIFILKYF